MGYSVEKVAFHTLGCKLNFSESSTLSRDFEKKGYSIVKNYEHANIHVINTCSVTEKADKKARQIVNKINNLHSNPYIAVIGCYAQLKPMELKKISGINLILDTANKFNLVNHVLNNYHQRKLKVMSSSINSQNIFKPSFSINDRTRSYLKIQDGCDYPCTYCTIPRARGKSRSDTVNNLINSIKLLSDQNVSEVVLSGVNIGDFNNGNNNFLNLIMKLESLNKIKRFRISSIEPNLLTEEIINFVNESPSFLPHFHIPLQSGSNKILKLMKRKYNVNSYRNKINMIRSRIKESCIGADVIVGFPGETQEDFEETFNFINKLDIDYLHVFSYSKRDNTLAKQYNDHLSTNTIHNRSKRLRGLSEMLRQNFYASNIGKQKKVLFESINSQGYLTGFSDNYVRILSEGGEELINKIRNVKLVSIHDGKVFGEIQ